MGWCLEEGIRSCRFWHPSRAGVLYFEDCWGVVVVVVGGGGGWVVVVVMESPPGLDDSNHPPELDDSNPPRAGRF